MERHLPGQEDMLMEVTVDQELPGVPAARPWRRRCHFPCAVALAVLLGLAAGVAAFWLSMALLCKPDACPPHPMCSATRVTLPSSSDQGMYNVFTAEKSADYVVYVWLRFSEASGQDVTLSQTFREEKRNISIQKVDKTEVSFLQKIKMVNGSKISLTLHVPPTDSLFCVWEL